MGGKREGGEREGEGEEKEKEGGWGGREGRRLKKTYLKQISDNFSEKIQISFCVVSQIYILKLLPESCGNHRGLAWQIGDEANSRTLFSGLVHMIYSSWTAGGKFSK